jgi:shikimate kinase
MNLGRSAFTRMSLGEKSIVFIGFMGVGKTTIGQLVASKLNRTFIDIDHEIEKEFQMPTTQIFKVVGEKAFREKEKSLISQLSSENKTIISVGGGAFLQEEVKEICLSNCMVIFLDISWQSWKERLNTILDTRPVLQGRTLDEIKELFYKRQESYSVHHLKVQIDGLDPDSIADYIMEALHMA